MSKVLAVFAVLFFSIANVYSQDFPMLHFTVEDGLPSNNIYQVYKDSRGFIWVGTDKGIARYNGIKFEVFTTFNGLADNEVFFFYEDKYGRLWMGTYNGELCFYKDGVFYTAKNTPYLKLPSKISHIGFISSEYDSSVTITYYDQAQFINIYNGRCHFFNYHDHVDPQLFSHSFLKKDAPDQYEIVKYHKTTFIDTLCRILKIDSSYTDMYELSLKDKLIFNQNFLPYDGARKARVLSRDFYKTHYTYQIYSNNNSIFSCTDQGLFINDSINILKGNQTSSITYDKNGNYWVGTLNNGLYCLKIDFPNTKSYNNCYTSPVVYAYAGKGSLFFSTQNNDLFSIRISNGQIAALFNYRISSGKDSISSENIQFRSGYFVDSNYRYYSLYQGKIVTIDNLLSPKIHVRHLGLSYGGVKGLFAVQDNIYVHLRNAIQKIPYSQLQTNNKIDPEIVSKTTTERIFSVAQAYDNSIWYSTLSRVYRIDKDSCSLQKQFKNLAFKTFSFLGHCLVGYTHNNNLLICEDINGEVNIDSVPEQNCVWDKLIKIDTNTLLISTDNLYRIFTLNTTGGKGKFTILTIENPFIPTHADAICSDAINCYFFKNGSITSVVTKTLFNKADPPNLYFTTLSTQKGFYTVTQRMQLPFDEAKTISISFATVSNSGKDIFYQYSVSKNAQDNWRDIVGDINLVHPSYGKYTIKIRAKSISSAMSQPITFTLDILKPFWATWWFIAISVCLLVATASIIIRYRIQALLRKKEKVHKTEIRFIKSEYKALNALMNPHFIFNTLNNVQDLVNKNDKLGANEYLRIFSDLIRQNMSNISKELIPLQKEIDLVTNYLALEKLRFEEVLNYTINIDQDLDLSEIMVPPLLIQPLVENSIKHGLFPLQSKEGYIQINIYEQLNSLYIDVVDNGVGLDYKQHKADPSHESFALQNIKKRIEQLSVFQNKEIKLHINSSIDELTKQQITTVQVIIPLSD